jgi:hypothetical protein
MADPVDQPVAFDHLGDFIKVVLLDCLQSCKDGQVGLQDVTPYVELDDPDQQVAEVRKGHFEDCL